MSLTGRFFAIFGFIQVVGLLATWRIEFLAFYLALVAWMIVVVRNDVKQMPEIEDLKLTIKAPRAPALAGKAVFSATVEPKREKALDLASIRILAIPTELFSFAKPSYYWRVDGHRGAVEIPAVVKRLGYAKVDKWPVAFVSKRGFLRRFGWVPIDPVELRVSPERQALSEQAFSELLKSQPVLRQGARMQVRSQVQDQILTIRKYQYPDPIKHIDHRKSARFGEPMTRTFDTLRNHHLFLVLDLGRTLSGEIRGSAKIDYYVSAALALAENAIDSRDEVSLLAFSEKRHFLIKRARHLKSFQALFRAEQAFEPRDVESDYHALAREIERQAGSRSIVVVLTDVSKPSVQDGLLKGLAPVCRKHLTVVAGINDRETDVDESVLAFEADKADGDFGSRYARLLYGYWLTERHQLFRDKMARLGGSSFTVNDAFWMTAVEKLYGLLRASRLA